MYYVIGLDISFFLSLFIYLMYLNGDFNSFFLWNLQVDFKFYIEIQKVKYNKDVFEKNKVRGFVLFDIRIYCEVIGSSVRIGELEQSRGIEIYFCEYGYLICDRGFIVKQWRKRWFF